MLQAAFENRLQRDVLLAPYTAARVGGPADFFLEVRSAGELSEAVSLLWEGDSDFLILGGGSNVLVSDRGVREVVLLNRARHVLFNASGNPPTVWAESGANFGVMARKAARRGLSGLEWAAGIPGTLGGAVVGNAGAHGGDVAGNLLVAEILQRNAQARPRSYRSQWPVERLKFGYRSSFLKGKSDSFVVLAAQLRLERSSPEEVKTRISEYTDYRRITQPPGASMGSMFKNPPGDYAGRLIEEAGLKGTRVGGAEISKLHANFFLNHGHATAADIYNLIQIARERVMEKFDLTLELEIVLIGEW
jgi:UDP-N-acetylmuramate dehydrogenase